MNTPVMDRIKLALPATGLAALLLAGCATTDKTVTIPKTDREAPEVRLMISGPGIGKQVMSNPPARMWDGVDGAQLFVLQPDAEYDFELTVSDPGGAGSAWIYFPKIFPLSDVSPEGVTNTTSGGSRWLTLQRTKKNPRSKMSISGEFRTPALAEREYLTFDIATFGYDLGGTSGRRNARPMRVQGWVKALEKSKWRKGKKPVPAASKPSAAEKPKVVKEDTKKAGSEESVPWWRFSRKTDEEKAEAKKEPVKKAAASTPAAKKPTVKKPAVKKPAVKKPAVKKPAVKKPAVKKPAVKAPAVKTPDVKDAAAPKSRSNRAYRSPLTGPNRLGGTGTGEGGETKRE